MYKEFYFTIRAVMVDAIYDSASIHNHIITTLKAKPRIAMNPQNTKNQLQRNFSKAGNPFCEARLASHMNQAFHAGYAA
jgi:hypothetical protein